MKAPCTKENGRQLANVSGAEWLFVLFVWGLLVKSVTLKFFLDLTFEKCGFV